MRVEFHTLNAAKARARHYEQQHNSIRQNEKKIDHTAALAQFSRLCGYSSWAELKRTGINPAAPINPIVDRNFMARRCQEVSGLNSYWAPQLSDYTFAFDITALNPSRGLLARALSVIETGAEAYCVLAGDKSYEARIDPEVVGETIIGPLDNAQALAFITEAAAACKRWHPDLHHEPIQASCPTGVSPHDYLKLQIIPTADSLCLAIRRPERTTHSKPPGLKTFALPEDSLWPGFPDLTLPRGTSMAFPDRHHLEDIQLSSPYLIWTDDLDPNGMFEGRKIHQTYFWFQIQNSVALSQAVDRLAVHGPLPIGLITALQNACSKAPEPGTQRAILGASLIAGDIQAIASIWRRTVVEKGRMQLHYEMGFDALFVAPAARSNGLAGALAYPLYTAAHLDVTDDDIPNFSYDAKVYMPLGASTDLIERRLADTFDAHFKKSRLTKVCYFVPTSP